MAISMVSRFLLALIAIQPAVSSPTSELGNTGLESGTGCRLLEAGYPSLTSFPKSEEYLNRTIEVWSETCLLYSTCVFEPRTAEHVAGALKILTKTKTRFAVRGGGHMPNKGAQGITDGVLIAMTQMKLLKLTQGGKFAQVGPGLRWGDVYDWISDFDLAVSGGRYSPVGVPGLLLGGGVNFFGSQYGWSANRIANMEVVLANGTIVNANADSNPGLYWALKGGSSNYGIVTRFDLKTFPFKSIYGGFTTYDPSYFDEYIRAIAHYCTAIGGSSDDRTHVNPSMTYIAATGERSLYSIIGHLGMQSNPASLANFTKIPVVMTDNSVRSKLDLYTNETLLPFFSDRSSRQVFRGTGLKATPEAVYLTNATFFEVVDSMPELKKAEGLLITPTHQTITTAQLSAARAAGGDPMDLDPKDGNLIIYLVSTAWQNQIDDALVDRFNNKLFGAIEAKAKVRGLYYDYKYLNDSPTSVRVFEAYGGGKSLPKMRAIARAYDPEGVFQKLQPGGFKLFY